MTVTCNLHDCKQSTHDYKAAEKYWSFCMQMGRELLVGLEVRFTDKLLSVA